MINDRRSLESWFIKEADESTLGKDSLVPLMHHEWSLNIDHDLDHPNGTHPTLIPHLIFPPYVSSKILLVPDLKIGTLRCNTARRYYCYHDRKGLGESTARQSAKFSVRSTV